MSKENDMASVHSKQAYASKIVLVASEHQL